MLEVDPEKRITVQQALKHPFFKEYAQNMGIKKKVRIVSE
jgi:serine/threonine protein kinase